MYLIITFLSYSLDSIYEFYLIACLIGFVQGGIQALSRSYFARLIPNGKHSEYFGIYNMLGKFAALIGPLLVGLVTYVSDNARLGILSISIFFIIGLIMFNKSLNYKNI
jgi:UMF1 family MFS transporter